MAPIPVSAILHADIDSMFAQVHQRDDPSLVGASVLVGGNGPRAVVAAASAEAKKQGARSAMSMAHAQRLCRRGHVVVAPDFAAYKAASAEVMAALADVADGRLVEQTSIDEAFLAVTTPDPQAAAEQAVGVVLEATHLTVSVGSSTTKLGAKLLSAWVKKDRGPGSAVWMGHDQLCDWMAPQPVTILPGCGPVTEASLSAAGIRTIGDLRDTDERLVRRAAGKAAAAWLVAAAWNRDDRQVERPGPRKQSSHEQTYDVDVDDLDVARRDAQATARRIAGKLHGEGRFARTVTVKMRTGDFQDLSRSRTMSAPSDDPAVLAAVAGELAAEVWSAIGGVPVRLVGVSASNLVEVAQPELFDRTVDPGKHGDAPPRAYPAS